VSRLFPDPVEHQRQKKELRETKKELRSLKRQHRELERRHHGAVKTSHAKTVWLKDVLAPALGFPRDLVHMKWTVQDLQPILLKRIRNWARQLGKEQPMGLHWRYSNNTRYWYFEDEKVGWATVQRPERPKHCSQCGLSFRAHACGPTHALLAAEAGKPYLWSGPKNHGVTKTLAEAKKLAEQDTRKHLRRKK
jgi:hypothetical protein